MGFLQKVIVRTGIADLGRKVLVEAGDFGDPAMPFSAVRSVPPLLDANHRMRSAAGRG
jgi:hypothetical protein